MELGSGLEGVRRVEERHSGETLGLPRRQRRSKPTPLPEEPEPAGDDVTEADPNQGHTLDDLA